MRPDHDNNRKWWRDERLLFWLIAIPGVTIAVGIAVGVTVTLGHMLGLPTYVLTCGIIVTLIFFAMPFVLGKVGEAHVLTNRRAIAFFGIIPGIAACVAVLLHMTAIRASLQLYIFCGTIVLGNIVYWLWFDVPANEPRKNGTEGDRTGFTSNEPMAR